MKVKYIDSPKNYQGGDWEPEQCDPTNSGADEIIYWYSSGSYCGAGTALLRKGDQWAVLDLGHCSCYGPWEDTPVYKDTPIEVSRAYYDEDLAIFNKKKLFKIAEK